MNSVPDMLSVRDVAQKLRRGPKYVRCLIHQGKLRAVRLKKPSGRFLVFPESVNALLGVSVERESEASLYRRAKAAGERLGYSHEPGDGTL